VVEDCRKSSRYESPTGRVAQVIAGEKARRRRDELTQGRPAERDDRGVRSVRAGGGKPLSIEGGSSDRIRKRIGEAVDEDQDVLPRGENVLRNTGMKRTGLGARYGGYGAAAFGTQVRPFNKGRGVNDQARVRRGTMSGP
jgi:hypothetical protein